MNMRAWLVAVGIPLAACSSTGSNNPDAGPQGTIFGAVTTQLVPSDQYATVTAQFYDAPPPPTIALKVSQEQNGCKLLIPVTCSPACGAGTYCTNAGTCGTKNPVSAGKLTVTGLGEKTLTIDPTPPMYAYAGPTLYPPDYTYPPCTEGSDITASSDKFAATTTKCISALTVTSTLPIPVTSGQPTHLTWAAPGVAGISRILISLEIAHHGGYKGQIDCDVPDTGSFDIPAPLVTGLVALGRAGYPDVAIIRVASKSPSNEPGVSVQMTSETKSPVDTGVISCGGPSSPACPTGMACDDGTKICK